MNFFERIGNGWTIAKTSMAVLKENPRLLIFPLLSGIALAFIFGAAALTWYGVTGFEDIVPDNRLVFYGLIFLLYLVNYTVVIFFNMSLMHCVKMYFDGDGVDLQAGLRFSLGRMRTILAWAVFAATVGTILKAIQENVGWIGKLIVGFIGIAWGVSTFFVVPVLAYENVGPVDALKRSAGLMKDRWGERLTAGFSFAMINILGVAAIVLLAFAASVIHPVVSIVIAVVGVAALVTVMSAVNSIFISAIYSGVTGSLRQHFNEQMMRGLFVEK